MKETARKLGLGALASLFLVAAPAGLGSAQTYTRGAEVQSPSARKPAPEASFTDGQGRPVSLGDFRGRVVLLNLWATWCAPCVKEMPTIDNLARIVGGEPIQVIALSVDRGGAATVRPFYERTGVKNLGIYLDSGNKVPRAFSVRGLPTTIVIDRQGREAYRLEGTADWDSKANVAMLRALAAEK